MSPSLPNPTFQHNNPVSPQQFTKEEISIVHGRSDPPLWHKRLSDLIDENEAALGTMTAAVFPWQNTRLSFQELSERSKTIAKAILDTGLQHGDCVGVMAGNRFEYIEIFLGAGRIGCPVLAINTTYTSEELKKALRKTACKLLFIATRIGPRDLIEDLRKLLHARSDLTALDQIVILGDHRGTIGDGTQHYGQFISLADDQSEGRQHLQSAERIVQPSDTLSLQFTSGTTGEPKAAMLSHINLLNNARFVGDAMHLSTEDITCCPPPLFHCFGLVIGFLGAFTHGSSIVFPSDHFDAGAVVEAVYREKATALLGVPTMFMAELDVVRNKQYEVKTIRVGLVAGSPVPSSLMEKLKREMGVGDMLIAYGMTETSPVTFISSLDDPLDRRATSLGRVMPHTSAKVINKQGELVKRGKRGEICTSGYALQKGYLNDEAQTQKVIKRDEDGVLWMHTGDECVIDHEGYCYVTGRIKDIIIRGGENISPLEIEERLLLHAAVFEASVVGVKDTRYGEAICCFLKLSKYSTRPVDREIQDWVRAAIGRHKAPQHIFWIGDDGVGVEFPKTGSGKYQKHILRKIGNRLLARTIDLNRD